MNPTAIKSLFEETVTHLPLQSSVKSLVYAFNGSSFLFISIIKKKQKFINII